MLIWHRRTEKHYGNRAYCDDLITKNRSITNKN